MYFKKSLRRIREIMSVFIKQIIKIYYFIKQIIKNICFLVASVKYSL